MTTDEKDCIVAAVVTLGDIKATTIQKMDAVKLLGRYMGIEASTINTILSQFQQK